MIALLRFEKDLAGLGHIQVVSLDFIDAIPHETKPVVDRHGQFVLIADVVLKFLIYEETVQADLVRGLRDAADQLEQYFELGDCEGEESELELAGKED